MLTWSRFWTFFWCAVVTGAGSAPCPAEAGCPGAQLEPKCARWRPPRRADVFSSSWEQTAGTDGGLKYNSAAVQIFLVMKINKERGVTRVLVLLSSQGGDGLQESRGPVPDPRGWHEAEGSPGAAPFQGH